jgi:tetratricopeptide (TPR) repeat protein
VAEGAGDASGPATGLKPGVLTALLQEVAAAPDVREVEPASLPPGTAIGRFEIIRELGRGGFGVVHEAKDRDLGRQVAVKLVRPGRITEEEGKVSREAEAIARLAHPNLITLHEVGRSEQGPFLVFEFLRGKTLQERLDDGPMPVQEAVHIAAEVARGLAHAHAEGVVHRDLKPSNVFVTNKGQVKILDFGMAHAFGRRRLSGGTPAYMAPEQWEDAPEDERTDVFALGVMLYRMLTGEYPFPEGKGRWAAEPGRPRKLDVPGTPELADLVEKMLERNPTARPRDGAAVLAALTPVEEKLRARPANGQPPGHAKRRKATFGDLLAELKRRHVFRVMAGYGIFAFAVLQVTEPIMHGAHLPEWVLTAVLILLALGFPVAVILAWIFDLTSQGVKRTASATGPDAPSFGRSRLLLPLAVSAAVLVLAAVGAGGWHAWRGAGRDDPKVPADGRTVVAVADFANRTGEPQLDAMTGLFVTSLEQSKKLVLLTRGRLVETARQLGLSTDRIDEVAGRGAGRKVGAAVLLVPTVHKLGATYVVELRALDLAKDQYRFTVKETAASQDQIIDLIDRLSDRTRRELHETPAEVAGSRVEIGKALTRSLEAYEHYLKGRELRLKQCDYLGAEREQRRALELDPEMGAAHMELGVLVLLNGGAREESDARFREARKRTASLPEKERRIVELDELVTPTVPVAGDKELQKAKVMKGLDELLARYPDDEFVLYWGGWVHSFFKEWEKALEFHTRSIVIDPGQCYVVGYAMGHLARLGRADEGLPMLRRAVEARPNATNRARLAQELARREPEEASRQAREALRLAAAGQTDAFLPGACALAHSGSVDEAVASARRLATEDGGTDVSRQSGRDLLAVLAAVRGRPREAGERYEPPSNPRRFNLNFNPRALLLAAGRSGNRSPAAAAELRDGPPVAFKAGELALFGDLAGAAEAAVSLEPGSQPEVHYRAVRAAVERRWGEAIPALSPMQTAWKTASVGIGDPRVAYRLEATLLLGEALLESGRTADALAVLESADAFVACGYMAAAHLPGIWVLRARAYEKLGRPADGLKDLDRLRALWKDAEPGLPLHAQAKAMRARLAAAPR